jgi:hypothetical protein
MYTNVWQTLLKHTFVMRSNLFLGMGAVGPKLLMWPASAFKAEYVLLQHLHTSCCY